MHFGLGEMECYVINRSQGKAATFGKDQDRIVGIILYVIFKPNNRNQTNNL